MSKLTETLKYLERLEKEILELHSEMEALKKSWEEDLEFKRKQGILADMNQKIENKKELYKAETKAKFGLADGEKAGIKTLVEAIARIQSFND